MFNDHMTPLSYAALLAKRHSDIGFIRAQCLRDYGKAPTREQIINLREEAKREAERQRYKATSFERVKMYGGQKLEQEA